MTLPGVGDDGRNVAGEEVLALAEADDQRRAAARAEQVAGQILVHQGDGVGAVHLARGTRQWPGRPAPGWRCRFGRALVEVIADEVGQHLGVGLREETVALALEAVPEGGVVLDDAVVDQGDLAGLVQVGMGVDVAGQAMRGPAGVADAERPGDRVRLERLRQALDTADPFAHVQRAAANVQMPGGVVAAIFQPAQALDEQRRRLFLANVSNYATHIYLSFPIRPRLPNVSVVEYPLAAADRSSTTSGAPVCPADVRSNSAP